MKPKLAFKGSLERRLEWRRDSEYGGKYRHQACSTSLIAESWKYYSTGAAKSKQSTRLQPDSLVSIDNSCLVYFQRHLCGLTASWNVWFRSDIVRRCKQMLSQSRWVTFLYCRTNKWMKIAFVNFSMWMAPPLHWITDTHWSVVSGAITSSKAVHSSKAIRKVDHYGMHAPCQINELLSLMSCRICILVTR